MLGRPNVAIANAFDAIEEIGDVDKFLSDWVSKSLIDDLVFIPQESQFDPRF